MKKILVVWSCSAVLALAGCGDDTGGIAAAGGAASGGGGASATGGGGAAAGGSGGTADVPECGDGALDADEACDDGNKVGGDGCSATCVSEPIVAVAEFHTCAISPSGSLKCWGRNDFGQLGLGDSDQRGGGPGEMGGKLPAIDLGPGRTAVAIAGGWNHTCAILDDASVKCWGKNDYGQLGLGDKTNRGDGSGEMGVNLPTVDLGAGRTAVAISSGGLHSCALLDDDSIKCWGDNGFGQLGHGDKAHRGDGPGEMGDNLPAIDVGAGRKVVTLVSGAFYNCAELDDDSVKCWGHNNNGQLGIGDVEHRGDGPNEMGANLTALDLGAGRTVKVFGASGYHACALLDDDSVRCWGNNASGQLGIGDVAHRGDGPDEMGANLPAVDFGPGRSATAFAGAGLHACALLDDGSVKCWGDNASGQLGLGDVASRGDAAGEMGANLPAVDFGSGLSAVAIHAGFAHTCALLSDTSIKCWGDNAEGQLGIGDTADRGDGAGEMGNSLPAVDLGF